MRDRIGAKSQPSSEPVAPGAGAVRPPARGRRRRRPRSAASKSQPCDPWRPGSGGGGGAALATVDSGAVSPSRRRFLSSQKWSSAETETAPFALERRQRRRPCASASFPAVQLARAPQGLRIQARRRPAGRHPGASKPVTKNSSTTSSTLWASRSRSKTTASWQAVVLDRRLLAHSVDGILRH